VLRPVGDVLDAARYGSITLRTLISLGDIARPVAAALGVPLPGRTLAGARAVSRVLERVLLGQFQRRASDAGSRAVHLLVARMMGALPDGSATRFHLVGHSLGCHVVTSAAIGRAPGSLLPRKIHSLTLLQAAVPLEYYERGGPYRPLSAVLRPVAGPVVATTSRTDFALANMEEFHGPLLGRAGFKGLAAPHEHRELRADVGAALGFEKGTFYTVEADAVINSRTKLLLFDLDGAHGDLLDEELLARVWEAADTDVAPADLEMTPARDLPPGYWDVDRTVRRDA
jgi:pimeloyl-ACP methyl ester carboxylesterase